MRKENSEKYTQCIYIYTQANTNKRWTEHFEKLEESQKKSVDQ